MSFLGSGAEVDSDGNVKTLSQTFQSEADEDVALLSQLEAFEKKPTKPVAKNLKLTECPVTADQCKATKGRCTWNSAEGKCTLAAKPAAAEPKEYWDP